MRPSCCDGELVRVNIFIRTLHLHRNYVIRLQVVFIMTPPPPPTRSSFSLFTTIGTCSIVLRIRLRWYLIFNRNVFFLHSSTPSSANTLFEFLCRYTSSSINYYYLRLLLASERVWFKLNLLLLLSL